LSFAQERLCVLDRLDPGNPAYNIPLAMRLRGPLNLNALRRTFDEIVARHESLRTKIVMADEQSVQIVESVRPQKLTVIDLEHIEPAEHEKEAIIRVEAEAEKPFRLDKAPLFRVSLLRFSPTEHVLVVVMHHIISDDWSLGVLFREVVALYHAFQAEQPSPLEPLPIQYADYAVWQRRRLQGKIQRNLLDYWCRHLEDVPVLELPTDRPRSLEVQPEGEGEDVQLPAALIERLQEVGRREGATLYMTLLATLGALLGRYSGQDDFAIGSPIAGRIGKGTEALVGFFVNALVIRTDLSGNPSFRSLLHRTRQIALEAFEHQELPFEQLVDALNPQRQANRNPVFQVMFTLHNAPLPAANIAGLKLSVIPFYSGTSKFDLSFTLREDAKGFQLCVDYRSDLFRPDTIRRMLKHFRVLLEAVAVDPDMLIGQIPLLTEAERRQLLVEWNDTARDYPSGCLVPESFQRQARQTPHAVAVIDGPRQWTYRKLDECANRLAHFLLARGIGPDRLVAVRLERSAELIVGILGVLKAGGAYLPIDPDAPVERLRFMLEDARIEVVLTVESLCDGLPVDLPHVICLDTDRKEIDDCSAVPPLRRTTGGHLAYVIYTSGSTGRPKGVMIEHLALANFTLAAIEQYGIRAEDRVLQFAATSFDTHIEEVFPCLTQGGTMVLRTDDMLDCRTFLQLCGQLQLTFISLPTGFWHELTTAVAEEGLQVPPTLRLLVIGGEQVLSERVATWFRCVGNRVRLLNTYGPTEATVVATAAELCGSDGQESRVPIGSPLGNVRVYVLDGCRQLTPVGVPGELYIGGKSLARGYLQRMDLTEERFLPDPFGTRPDARMYRTGDVVRWRTNGVLEFVGRTDSQVKIRGFRIEPGEVEQVLREHPVLTNAAVVVRERVPGDLQLVAYLVGRPGTSPTPTEVREFLRDCLPEFMVPATFVNVDSLPMTASGKVDRRCLPEPDWSYEGLARQGDFVAPRTPTEQQLAVIWSEVLHVDPVGVDDNFFDLGGNSLLAMQLAPRVRKVFSLDLPLLTLFESPTLIELAAEIDRMQANPRETELPSISRVPRDAALSASFSQERFWFLQQLAPESPLLNLHGTLRITGELQVDMLLEAVNNVVQRHESLRTTFTLNGTGRLVQEIIPQVSMELPVIDLCYLSADERTRQIRQRSKQQAEEPFDLGRGPLLRVQLLRLGNDEHVLLVTVHHIICDAWSLEVLSSEVALSYTARQTGNSTVLPELPVQYADFAVWQREYLSGEPLESHLDYWRIKLQGLMPLELPADRPRRPAELREQRLHYFEVSPRVTVGLDRLCSEENVTLYMLLLAAFQVLLHRYSDSDDVVVGSPVANRRQPDTQRMIGLFVNTLILRSDMSGDPSFRELLVRVRQTAIEAYDHQELPFERIVEELQPERDLGRHPLVQVLFDFEQRATAEESDHWGRAGLEFESLDATREFADVFDLVLWMSKEEHGLEGQFAYDSSLFDAETVARMAGHLQTLLEALAAGPDRRISQLPLLTDPERKQVLVEFNRTEIDLPQPVCVHQLFESQVESTPEALASVCDGRTMNYRQLNTRANQLAHYLQQQGVGPVVLVGICLEPSLDLPVALLAVLKAGGMYLPLDHDEPLDRLDYFIGDGRPNLILTTYGLADRFSARDVQVVLLDTETKAITQKSRENPTCRTTPDSAISLLYTSGSTGKPKGAVNRHRGVCNYLLYKRQLMGLGSNDRVLLVTPISFDTSVEEFFLPLISGGCQVIAKAAAQRDPGYLTRLIGRERVTTACFVPTMLRLLLEDMEGCDCLKRVISGGEALTPDLMESFFERLDAELYNDYGPTETSIAVSTWKCRPDYQRGIIPIGRPISNVRLFVLDGDLKPVPVGVPGELYIGGVAVGDGYLNRPELNAERFLPDPFSGVETDTIYRTGDRCRWLPDGHIEFLGRRDNQVKIYGARVELGEVEAAVCGHPQVAYAAAVVRQSAPGFNSLAAYVVPRGRQAQTADARREFVQDLQRYLKATFPAYLVPQVFKVMEALPQLVSGKVNRAALLTIAPVKQPVRRYVAPRTPLEQQLAAIWAELLKVDRVGAHDNFFELGGHSLLAVRMMVQARAALGTTLPVTVLFAAPTVAELAERMETAQRGEIDGSSPAPDLMEELTNSMLQPPRGDGRVLVPLRKGGASTPLFCIHGLGGHVAGFLPLAAGLAEPRPVFGLQAQGLAPQEQPHDSVEVMATSYLQAIRKEQPHGPYLLAGWSMGGVIALEVAHQLRTAGREVALVALLDTYLSPDEFPVEDAGEHSVIRWLAPHLNLSLEELKRLPLEKQWDRIAEQTQVAKGVGVAEIRRLARVCVAHLAAMAAYTPPPYPGRAVLFRTETDEDLDQRWQSVCPGLRVEMVTGNHYSMLRKPYAEALADRLDRCLRDAIGRNDEVATP
jgi:amino acid adenylation domain-containing protein